MRRTWRPSRSIRLSPSIAWRTCTTSAGAAAAGARPMAGARKSRAETRKAPTWSAFLRDRNTEPPRLILARVLLAELLDAALGVHDLLLAGEERMAVGAHLDVQLVSQGRARGELVAA